MKHSKLQLIIICVLSLFTAIAVTSCTKVEEAKTSKPDTFKVDLLKADTAKVAKVDSSKWCLIRIGIASYYNYPFHGRKTATGEVYHKDSLTCSFYINPKRKREYLNQYIRVCTDTCIIIKVTDNGSFVEKYNRVVDLSEASIKLLGKKDLLNVKIYSQLW